MLCSCCLGGCLAVVNGGFAIRYLTALQLCPIFVHELDGMLVSSPLSGNGDIFRRHGCGNLLVPACKGVTGPGGICRNSYGCTIVCRDRINGGTAIGVKGDGEPLCSQLCRQINRTAATRCPNIRNIPTSKLITCCHSTGIARYRVRCIGTDLGCFN